MIFIDVNMPGTNGFATTRMIREIQSNTMRSSIILTSAEYINVDQDRSVSAGADSFLEKPVQLDSLRSIVKTFACPTKQSRKRAGHTNAVTAD
jgi:two-component system sensor histidine kinase BarA